MHFQDAILKTCKDTFAMFGFNPEFIGEDDNKVLNSAEPINILVGLTKGLRGNVAIGFYEKNALSIVSTMIGSSYTEVDDMAKSALGEMVNMLIGSAISMLDSSDVIEVSPPTLVTGEGLFLMISNVPSKSLLFSLNGEKFHISYSIG